MQEIKQVDKAHYEFDRYMQKPRWNSVWHQLDEVLRLKPKVALEIGPGPGLFKNLAGVFGLTVETLDMDPDLKPDHIGKATALPFENDTFDVVCAFQVLEHLPYEESLKAFREMARVSRHNIVISLPDSKKAYRYQLHFPKLGSIDWLVSKPSLGRHVHEFDGQHYWEINKRGYELEKVVKDLSSVSALLKTYRVSEYPYHRFFIFQT